jgi:hypothetical protein
VPALFAVTLFASALLLFLVQPMVGKMVLPHVGGSPTVWNTCMVFFQALLLAGYAYAHKLTSLSSQRKQVAVHLGVLGFAVAVMAVAFLFSEDGSAVPVLKSLAPRGSVFPFFWVILMMLVAIGVPFFAVSASAPLLQRWFTATGHPSSRDPYFLYAASNAGSLISLLCYPFLVEPNLRLNYQTWLFGGGFAVLLLMTLWCGRASMNPVRPPSATGARLANGSPPPPLWRKLKWVALAFVPSSLMLGITTKMTTDVASVPLLWIIPLTLYLLTFIIAYSRMPGWFRLVLSNLTPVVTLLLVFVETSGVNLSAGGQAALHISNFFLLSLLMHGELAHDRPDPKHLTGYFLWISFGGVCGGLFNSLLAPLLFSQLYEYHIAIVVGCLLLPTVSEAVGPVDDADPKGKEPTADATTDGEPKAEQLWILSRVLDVLIPLSMVAVVGWLVWASGRASFQVVSVWTADALSKAFAYCGLAVTVSSATVMQFAVFAPPCMLCFLFIDRPVRFGLCVLAVLFVHHYREADQPGVQRTIRSYHGIMRIDSASDDHEQQYMPRPKRTVTDKDGKKTQETVEVSYFVEAKLRGLSHGTTLHGKQYVRDFRLPMLRDDVRAFGAFSGWEALALAGGPLAWDHTKDPLTYYHRTGPVGDIFREGFRRTALPRVGMVGLGTGSVAAYAVAGQKMTFYEIDKAVEDLIETGDELNPNLVSQLDDRRSRLIRLIETAQANDVAPAPGHLAELESVEQLLAEPVRGILVRGGKVDAVLAGIEQAGVTLTVPGRQLIASENRGFTYVTDARKRGADVDIVLGDARLTLEEHTDRAYDLLLIDAFSSDSIPTHLLTVEAVRMYRDRLAANGLLAMHVSNRYLRLEPVVQAIATELGMVCRLFADDNDAAPGKTASSWVVLARNDAELGDAFLAPPPPVGSYLGDGEVPALTWRPILPHARISAWTDDYMDVLRVTRFAELQAVRRWFGLEIPVKNWEEKTKFVDRQYRKPAADRLYGLDSERPNLEAVSRDLDRVLARKAELREAELRKPVADRRFGMDVTNPDPAVVSERLDDEIDRLEELDADRKRSP